MRPVKTFLRFSALFVLTVFCLSWACLSAADDSSSGTAASENRQQEPAQAPAQETVLPAAESEETPAAGSADVQMSSPGNVTVDFKDADIQNVLRILAFKSGVNIVAGKDVTGSVTIRLVDVPWEKALDVILKTYGYAYDRHENIIRVATLENLRKE